MITKHFRLKSDFLWDQKISFISSHEKLNLLLNILSVRFFFVCMPLSSAED